MITRAIKDEVNSQILYGGKSIKGILADSKQATYFVDTGANTTINAQVNAMYKKYYGSEEYNTNHYYILLDMNEDNSKGHKFNLKIFNTLLYYYNLYTNEADVEKFDP
jgi:hypothetical protein